MASLASIPGVGTVIIGRDKNLSEDEQIEFIRSGGGQPKLSKDGGVSDRYWEAVDSTSEDSKRPYGAKGDPDGEFPNYRQRKLSEDLRNTQYADAASKLGIAKFNSANDLGQVLAYLNGNGKKTADPAKATQAVQAAVGWKDQNSGQGGGMASGSGGSGFVPGGQSYAASLAGNSSQRDGLYDNIAARGAGMVDSFRSIGRDYYMRANQDGKDIAQAGWDALNALSPDVKPVDFVNPFTTPVGKKGQTLVAMSRDLING